MVLFVLFVCCVDCVVMFVLFVLVLSVLLLVVAGVVCCLETTKTPQRQATSLLLFVWFESPLFFVCFVVLVFLSWCVCSGLFSLLLGCC